MPIVTELSCGCPQSSLAGQVPQPNVGVEWLTLLLLIREVPGSNLDMDTGYPG
jgi:hypothetical protein